MAGCIRRARCRTAAGRDALRIARKCRTAMSRCQGESTRSIGKAPCPICHRQGAREIMQWAAMIDTCAIAARTRRPLHCGGAGAKHHVSWRTTLCSCREMAVLRIPRGDWSPAQYCGLANRPVLETSRIRSSHGAIRCPRFALDDPQSHPRCFEKAASSSFGARCWTKLPLLSTPRAIGDKRGQIAIDRIDPGAT